MRQEKRLALTLGELAAGGEAGASLLSCKTDRNVRRRSIRGGWGGCHYLHLLQNTVGQPRSEVELFRFRALGLGLVDDPHLIVLLITEKNKKLWIYSVEIFFKMICMIRIFFFFFLHCDQRRGGNWEIRDKSRAAAPLWVNMAK